MLSSDKDKMLSLKSCAAGSETLLAIWREFEEGKLAHAYLFTGESGVGKKTFARTLAKALLCEGEGDKPCGVCRSCKRFEAATHGNVYFPVPQPKKTTISVDDMRNIISELGRSALEGGRRVIVFNQAEKMSPQAQNSLLKTLEEAGEGVFFLLVTDNERAVLPTIRSRCRTVRVPLWNDERVARELMNMGLSAAAAKELAAIAEGSMGKAVQMIHDDSWREERALVKETFLKVRSVQDISACSRLLKNKKDQAETLFSILERELRQLIFKKESNAVYTGDFFPEQWKKADVKSLMRIQDSILRCMRYKASNIGWAANAEGLMQSIAEEATKWQL